MSRFTNRFAWALAGLLCTGSACVDAASTHDATVVIVGFRGNTERPICGAFAVQGPRGIELLTAAHCLRDAGLGDSIAYATREQWEHTAAAVSRARVTSIDTADDRATLMPEPGLDSIDSSPLVPDAVVSVAPGWHLTHGHVTEHVGRYFTSTLDVRPGWSGSPVLDARGRAVGIVVACEAVGGVCVPKAGIFVGLGR